MRVIARYDTSLSAADPRGSVRMGAAVCWPHIAAVLEQHRLLREPADLARSDRQEAFVARALWRPRGGSSSVKGWRRACTPEEWAFSRQAVDESTTYATQADLCWLPAPAGCVCRREKLHARLRL